MSGENSNKKSVVLAPADLNSGSTLVPMLVSGLIMIVLGMIAVAVMA